MDKKVLLCIPNSRWFGKRPWNSLPYAAVILTSLLKKDFDFQVLDINAENLDFEQTKNRIQQINPVIVLVTGISVEYHKQSHKTLSLAKSACPNSITVLGGVYPTTLPEECVKDKNIDWLFMYHAEGRINHFINLLLDDNVVEAKIFPGIAYRNNGNECIENPPSHFIGEVKTIANPDYSLVDLTPYLKQDSLDYQFNSDKPTAYIISSYGCPYNCLFCASRTISGRKVMFRPVQDILDEIDYLVSQYHVSNLIFLDDCILADRKRINNILNGLIDREYDLSWKVASLSAWHLDDELIELMKKAGCTQFTISVESGSQKVLSDIIRKPLKLEIIPGIIKKCRAVGIDLGANFVIGIPGETWEDIRRTFKFAEECDFDVAHFHIATPLPKTDLYRLCQEKGYLPENFNFLDDKFFGYMHGWITTEEFTPIELSILRSFEWDRINFSTPDKIKRMTRLYKTTPDKLIEHRRQTRRKIGLHF